MAYSKIVRAWVAAASAGTGLGCMLPGVGGEAVRGSELTIPASDLAVIDEGPDCNENGVSDTTDIASRAPALERLAGASIAGSGVVESSLCDVDGDGDADVVAADSYDGISVALNDGLVLTAARIYGVPAAGQSVSGFTARDLNADGRCDLFWQTHNTAGVSWNRGVDDGGFPIFEPVAVAAGVYPQYVGPNTLSAADLDGDGQLDLVLPAVVVGDTVGFGILPGLGAEQFGPTLTYLWTNTCGWAMRSAAGDMNGDDVLDLVFVDRCGRLRVHLQRGGFVFDEPLTSGVGNAISLTLADLDRDGDLDAVSSKLYTNTVSIARNDATGTLTVQHRASGDSSASGTSYVAVGDLDGDHFADLLVSHYATSQVSILVNDRQGGLRPPALFSFGAEPRFTAPLLVDLDGDGDRDVVLLDRDASSTEVATLTTLRNDTVAPTSLDVDGNGIPDECSRLHGDATAVEEPAA